MERHARLRLRVRQLVAIGIRRCFVITSLRGRSRQREVVRAIDESRRECAGCLRYEGALASAAPVVAVSDYAKSLAEPLRGAITAPMHVLGTDGFGRSDTRAKLRHFFEVNRYFIVISALSALVDEAKLDSSVIKQALKKYGISPDKIDPTTV